MIELQILNRILSTRSFQIIILNGWDASYFPNYKIEFKFIKEHYEKYNVIPDIETFIDEFPNFDLIKVYEADDFLIKKMIDEHTLIYAEPKIREMLDYLSSGDMDKGIDYMMSLASDLAKINQKSLKSIDLIKNANLRFEDYLKRTRDLKKSYFSTGRPELDKILGGWSKEDLVVVSARPGVGKSWSVFDFALASAEEGYNVGLYSGEMHEHKVGYRVDTLKYGISNWALTHGDISVQVDYESKIKNIQNDIKGSIHVTTPQYFGGSATVSKLRAFIERENIDILYIDQFSLLRDERNARDRNQAGANISEDLKNMIMVTGCPVVIAAQLNRGAIKEGKTEAGLDNLAITDRLGQDASIVLGLSQQITGEGTKLLIMEVLKNREGEDGGKLTYIWKINIGELIYTPTEKDGLNGESINEVRDIYSGDSAENNF